MSDYFDSASDIITSANGIHNGVNLIDGVVPDLSIFLNTNIS